MNRKSQFDEHEWQLQERALREERDGAPVAGGRGLAAYRHVAGALRRPPAGGLPADFAAQVAALAGKRAAPEALLEQWLTHALLALLASASVVAFALYGGRAWVADTLALLPPSLLATGLPWALVLVGCLALSWAADPLRRRLAGRDSAAG